MVRHDVCSVFGTLHRFEKRRVEKSTAFRSETHNCAILTHFSFESAETERWTNTSMAPRSLAVEQLLVTPSPGLLAASSKPKHNALDQRDNARSPRSISDRKPYSSMFEASWGTI
jgi:hypothetical protein